MRKNWLWTAAVLTALGLAQSSQAQAPIGFVPGGVGGPANPPYRPFEFNYGYVNHAWLYPFAGYTLYPGQVGSCVQAHSDYARVNWTVPPAVNAQAVLSKLQALGIPLEDPETTYLGKKPRGADNIKLPVPKGWTRDEPEKEVERPGEKIPQPPEKIPLPLDKKNPVPDNGGKLPTIPEKKEIDKKPNPKRDPDEGDVSFKLPTDE